MELSVLPDDGWLLIPYDLWITNPNIYGAEGDRTPDLCNANAALSQLSYSPSLPKARHSLTTAALRRNETAPRGRDRRLFKRSRIPPEVKRSLANLWNQDDLEHFRYGSGVRADVHPLIAL